MYEAMQALCFKVYFFGGRGNWRAPPVFVQHSRSPESVGREGGLNERIVVHFGGHALSLENLYQEGHVVGVLIEKHVMQ